MITLILQSAFSTFLGMEACKPHSLCLYRVRLLGKRLSFCSACTGRKLKGGWLATKGLLAATVQILIVRHYCYWLEISAGLDDWWIPGKIQFLSDHKILWNMRKCGKVFPLEGKYGIYTEGSREGISGSSSKTFWFPGSHILWSCLFPSNTSKMKCFPCCDQGEAWWHQGSNHFL